MQRIPGLIAAAAFLSPVQVPAQAEGGCIRLDHAETLAWSRGEGGAASGITLADHADAERPSHEDLHGFLVRGTGSDCLKRITEDYASVVETCRDALSGQVHSVIHAGSGQYSVLQIWSVDSETGEPVREYSEGWVDSYKDSERDLVAPDGRCLWRERQSDRKAVNDAVTALRVGGMDDGAAGPDGLDVLPVRPLSAETVLGHLRPLEGIATMEGAVYASDADHAGWRVVQVRGDAICDAHGVVLVLNRTTGQWHSVYDVRSGCSRTLDHPLYGMRVSDGHLTASACTECPGPGLDANMSVNLQTWQVRRLHPGDPSQPVPFDAQNPRITDVDELLLGD